MAKFYINNSKISYTSVECRLERCPFKHCEHDILGYLGGKYFNHHCPKHGLIQVKLNTSLDDSFVETFEMPEKVSWSFQDLIDRKILHIKFLDKHKNIIVEL